MNLVVGIIVVVALAAGAYFYLGEKAEAPTIVDDAPAVPAEAPAAPESADDAPAAAPAPAASEPVVSTPDPAPAPAEAEAASHTFDVSGSNFAFDVKEMRVQQGDTVTVNFTSASGFHDWVVDEFDAATKQVRPGTPTSVTFVADTAGSFEYYCSVGSHRAQGMVGTLIVE